MAGEFGRIDESKVHQGYVWHVVTAEFEAPDGRRFHRDIVRSPGAVGVVPLVFDAEGNASAYVYDGLDRRVQATDASGDMVEAQVGTIPPEVVDAPVPDGIAAVIPTILKSCSAIRVSAWPNTLV